MANNRIFYACQAVAIGNDGIVDIVEQTDGDTYINQNSGSKFNFVKGLQSVGINTTFNLEQAFEIGQISIYENIEEVPDVEVTLEKVLDGFPLLFHMGTPAGSNNTLVGRSTGKVGIRLGVYGDGVTSSQDTNSENPVTEVYCSGMFLSNVSYTLPVDGNCTESVTFVGNDKRWYGAAIVGSLGNGSLLALGGSNYADDTPQNLLHPSGGIQRRENVDFARSQMPTSLAGISTAGSGNNLSNNFPIAHVQSIAISTDLGREPMQELGRKGPYHRFATFPIEVTCDIECYSISGDAVQAFEEGDPANVGTTNEGNNTPEERISVRLDDGTDFDLGGKNRLSSVSYGGGDAGGGNVTVTYSYTNFNDLSIRHRFDPNMVGYNAGYIGGLPD